ncbi:MAG: DUF2922 family protein [Synergistaceae bacterium]
MRTVKLKFMTDAGKSFSVSMNYASEALLEDGGKALLDAAADAVMANQPFNVTLAAKKGAEVIDTNVTVFAVA